MDHFNNIEIICYEIYSCRDIRETKYYRDSFHKFVRNCPKYLIAPLLSLSSNHAATTYSSSLLSIGVHGVVNNGYSSQRII